LVDLIIDATDCIVGRVATHAATEALHGKNVHIVHAEKAVFSGQKDMVVAAWKRRFAMGAPSKGPFIRRQPDRLFRRVIRGMLPKNPRGREAFGRILCHVGQPAEFKDAKSVPDTHMEKLPNTRVVTVATVCRELGGRWHE